MSRVLPAVMFFCATVAACLAEDQIVVSNTYQNLDTARALVNVPVTFSRIGALGDFVDGITPAIDGDKLPAQVDVLRRAPDGSIRHALVSFVLPALPPAGTVKIDWLNQPAPEPDAFQWAIDRAGFNVALTLEKENGSLLTSDAGRLLGKVWSDSEHLRVLYDGPVMKEYEIHDIPVD